MPAVTADTINLTKLDVQDPTSRDRSVVSITTAPSGFEGEGFPVRRAFAGVDQRLLDPFIHMDEMGEVDYAPYEPKGTDWHPHRGFETVTYMIEGTFEHQDSHGGGGVIENGATQWMTAGSGILHIETPPEQLVISGGLFHGVQLWVNLPAKDKMISPAYQNLEGNQVTLLSSPDGGALVRLIAGDIGANTGPGSTHTPIAMAHATLAPGARLVTPWNPTFNSLAYILAGSGTVGVEQRPVGAGQLVVFGEGDSLTITNTMGTNTMGTNTGGSNTGGSNTSRPNTGAQSMEVLLLGGQPLREPVAQYGPFVMNHRHELQQAVEDYNAGRLGSIPANGLHPYRS